MTDIDGGYNPELDPPSPEDSTEVWGLKIAGFGYLVDVDMPDKTDAEGNPVPGRYFTRAYRNQGAVVHTLDAIEGLREGTPPKPEDQEEYDEALEMIRDIIAGHFNIASE